MMAEVSLGPNTLAEQTANQRKAEPKFTVKRCFRKNLQV